MLKSLEELINIIRSRKNSDVSKSYTARLLNNKVLSNEKVEEEFQELLEAIKTGKNQTHEAADLMYHFLVTLEASHVKFEDVLIELNKRTKQSGIEEKKKR